MASRDLAAAARRDSSAMKSIAVLTMAFLPGTFFATLFSMPSLGWDQPRHFSLYWVYTIPFTVATFIIWAIYSQRNVLRRWATERYLWLPLWCLIHPDKEEDISKMNADLRAVLDLVKFQEDYSDYRGKFDEQRYRAKERLRNRINRWKPW